MCSRGKPVDQEEPRMNASGDGEAFKDGRRGRKDRVEGDESELMAVWTSLPRKPGTHTQRSYYANSVKYGFRNTYLIRNKSTCTIKDVMYIGKVLFTHTLLFVKYMIPEYLNPVGVTSDQENDGFESGYASRCLEKEMFHKVGKSLFEEQRAKAAEAGKKFHDVVHSLVFEGIRMIVLAGTMFGLITGIILTYFSHLFFVAVQSRRRKVQENKRRNRRRKVEVKRKHKIFFLVVLVYSNLGTAKRMADALKKLAETSQLKLQGVQACAREMRSAAAASAQREQNIAKGYANTLQAMQQYTAKTQRTFEEIGSSLESSERKKRDEVQLHKFSKSPEAFSPGTVQE